MAIRPLVAVLALLCGSALQASLHAAADDQVPLVVRPLDEVHLKNGAPVVAGRVVEVIDGVSVRVRKPGSTTEILLQWNDIDHIERKQSAAEAVNARGAQDLAAGDVLDLKKTIKWGIDNGAKDAAVALAKQGIAKRSSPELAEMVEPLLEDQDDLPGAIALVQPLLDADPQWTFGYETLARVYTKQKNEGELQKLVDRWLQRQPSAQTPNRYRATASELSGDLRSAQEAYRKGYDLYHDPQAGVGYARIALKRGDNANALQTAEALIQANQAVDDARAIAGVAWLAQGDAAKAQPLLTQALGGKLAPEMTDMADIVRYDLGLIAYRAGNIDQARQLWKDVHLPAADLGLAMLDRKPYQRAKELPPDLQAVAVQYNACVDLENGRFDRAQAQIDPRAGRRDAFLAQLAALKNPTDDAVKAVAATASPESLRWQAYAHILGRRWSQAESALAQLPPNDGYAAVCRVYIAEGRMDKNGARVAFAAVRDSVDPPADYVEKLSREYEAADDRVITEHFEGSATDLLQRDWKFSQQGTGIQIKVADSRLAFEGTQTAGDDPVTRVFRHVPAAGVRFIQATFDLAGANGAVCGLEMLDLGRTNGIAFGVLGNNHFGWLQVKDGQWGKWTDLDVQAHANQVLRMELNQGAVVISAGEDPPLRLPVGRDLFRDQAELCIGMFGTADAGVAWSLGVREFVLSLRPTAKAPQKR
jgi:tetratricopeptide (TPR) repeat protein